MKYRTVLSIVTALVLVTPAFADLQDWEFNVNGTDYYPANGDTFASVPGLNSSGFNSTTGLGTLQLVFNAGPGSYYVGAFFFDPVGIPFYNEYGAVNGSTPSGRSWQIDVPEYDVSSTANHGAGTIVDHLANESLNDTNTITGTTDNYLKNCGANGGGSANASCNDFVSMAQGLKFTLGANQEEVITLTLGTSDPGGFSLEDIHPVDGSNSAAADIFYSATAMTEPNGTKPPPPVPEPASWSLLGLGGGILTLGLRRRASRLNKGECK